ncbi:MAG: mucoidy inhibitor MuiA family protein [Chlamydiae bacterium]|nr:mucoidy inhibitor MuiA family protein [Chlamydiota bacterium]
MPFQAVFKDLPDLLEEDSLKALGRGEARVKILGLETKRVYLEKPYEGEIRKLKEAVTQTEDEISVLDDQEAVLDKEKSLVEGIRVYSGEQFSKEFITRSPSPDDWEKMVQFMTGHLSKINEEKMSLTQKKREWTESLDVMKRKLSELSSGTRSKRHVTVQLEALSAGHFELEVSYVLPGASWYPGYEARASLKEGKVEFSSVGNVKQITGEDWKGVELSLSTARPAVGAQMPKIEAWELNPYQPPLLYQSQAAPEKMERLGKGRVMYGLTDDYSPEPQRASKEEALVEAEVAMSETIRKGTAVEFKIPGFVDIPSDQNMHKVWISALDLAGKFHYLATPKLSPYAYLVADVKNESDIQFLEGDVRVFLEGDFVGTSHIEPVAPGEEVSLHLGIDEGLEIKREGVEDKQDETSFFSKKKEWVRSYKIKIKNFKDKDVELTLWDQIPVSNHEDIVVDEVQWSEKPVEQTGRGLVKWVLNIPAKQEKEVTIHFRITYPTQMQVEGLEG